MLKVAAAGLVPLLLCLASAAPALAQPAGPGDTIIIIEPAPQQPMPPQQQPMPPQQQPYPAGPGMRPRAAPAPQNESWRNVSHINGRPVPVGTRDEYLYRFRRTNLSINPVGWMLGFYSGSLSHAITDNVVLRGDVTVFSSYEEDEGFVEFNATVPIYFRRAYQGPFVEPGVMLREWGYGDTTAGPQVMVGWHWTYDSGWNMSFALGGGRDFSGEDSPDSYEGAYENEDEPFFNGYFRIGYAF